jgi:hypothetical protein
MLGASAPGNKRIVVLGYPGIMENFRPADWRSKDRGDSNGSVLFTGTSMTLRAVAKPGFLLAAIAILTMPIASRARAGSILIHLPPDVNVIAAVATPEKLPKDSIKGVISADQITFADPVPGNAYEARLTLKDGTVLQGVDMGWYSRVPEKADAGPLSEDDRQQMTAVFSAGAQFFNVQEATLIKGNHDRAVMLVRLERSNGFHSDAGNEIIWRPELWYFENHHGGWEKVLQTDRVLRRERFADPAAYHAVVDKLKWVVELGGLKSTLKKPEVVITLPASVGVPMRSGDSPASQQSVPAAGGPQL